MVSWNGGTPQIIRFNGIFHYTPIHLAVPPFMETPNISSQNGHLHWTSTAPSRRALLPCCSLPHSWMHQKIPLHFEKKSNPIPMTDPYVCMVYIYIYANKTGVFCWWWYCDTIEIYGIHTYGSVMGYAKINRYRGTVTSSIRSPGTRSEVPQAPRWLLFQHRL